MMTLNAVDTTRQIQAAGEEAEADEQEKLEQMESLLKVFQQAAEAQEAIRSYLIGRKFSGLRFAVPHHEGIADTFPCPYLEQPFSRIATDGSQIAPDKNSPKEFAAISVSMFKMNPSQNQNTPFNQTLIRTGKKLKWKGEKIDSDYLELLRDVRERSIALPFIRRETGCVVLFDGIIELFRAPGNTPGKRAAFNKYKATLRIYCARNIPIAGYVDAPKGRITIDMLELSLLCLQGNNYFTDTSFPDLDDFDLWAYLLKPGERSAVFQVQSPSSNFYSGDLGIHVFFVNAQMKGFPRIARIEVPRYVALSKAHIDAIHATIVADSLPTGGYPYSLFRAHELAELTSEDKRIIEDGLALELRRRGINPHCKSRKQELKDCI